jgi:hypothetical protein
VCQKRVKLQIGINSIPDVAAPMLPGDPFELLPQTVNRYDRATGRRFPAPTKFFHKSNLSSLAKIT